MSEHASNGKPTNGSANGRARTVVIFGGAGFIGSNWADRLLSSSCTNVHIFDNLSRPGAEWNLRRLRAEFGDGRLRATIGDIRDYEQVKRVAAGADEIYHLA